MGARMQCRAYSRVCGASTAKHPLRWAMGGQYPLLSHSSRPPVSFSIRAPARRIPAGRCLNGHMVRLHPHALERLSERGVTEDEVVATVQSGESFPAKFGRTGFRRNFRFDSRWRGQHYATKEVEAFAVREGEDWLVLTVVTRYY